MSENNNNYSRSKQRRIRKNDRSRSIKNIIYNSKPTNNLIEFESLEYNVQYEVIILHYGSIYNAAMHSLGCRYIQTMLKSENDRNIEKLIIEFNNNIGNMALSPHGNYVIQKIITILPISKCLFIIDELENNNNNIVMHMVCNQYGCRIIQRLIEHALCEPRMMTILDNLLKECDKICRNIFGKYVIHHILEYSENNEYNKIIINTMNNVLQSNIDKNIKERNKYTGTIICIFKYSLLTDHIILIKTMLNNMAYVQHSCNNKHIINYMTNFYQLNNDII